MEQWGQGTAINGIADCTVRPKTTGPDPTPGPRATRNNDLISRANTSKTPSWRSSSPPEYPWERTAPNAC
eukprot:11213390-Lingulodinium_polyedra.AAC.1